MITYNLTDEEYAEIQRISKPQAYLVMGGVPPVDARIQANAFWQKIANEQGLEWLTIRAGSSPRQILAERKKNNDNDI